MATESEPNEAAVEAEPKSGQPSAAAPEELIVLPVRDAVLMPGAIMPIVIGREISIAAAQQAVREERQIGLLMQRFRATDFVKARPVIVARVERFTDGACGPLPEESIPPGRDSAEPQHRQGDGK